MARLRSVLAARRPPQPSAEPAKPPEAGEKEAPAGRPRRVLLVEDEVVLRMSTTDMLERLGCFVAGVGSGEQALELLARGGSFDLLLTDLGLPGMSGEELAAGCAGSSRRCRSSSPAATAAPAGRPRACSSFPSPIRRSICSRRSITPAGWRLPDSSRSVQPGAASWRSCGRSVAMMGGTAMRTILSKPAPALSRDIDKGPLHGELLDVYMAILIVIPVALFVKSLWA